MLPLLLLGTVIFQGLLGMWTVTLLVKPLIVVAHLFGGLSTMGLAFWLILEARRRQAISAPRVPRAVFGPALFALLVLACQIALGGWTSSNYAALACPDLPQCVGQWWPEQADFSEAFVLWRGLGVNYEGGVLDAAARVAIHFTHRLGAVITLAGHDRRRRPRDPRRFYPAPVTLRWLARARRREPAGDPWRKRGLVRTAALAGDRPQRRRGVAAAVGDQPEPRRLVSRPRSTGASLSNKVPVFTYCVIHLRAFIGSTVNKAISEHRQPKHAQWHPVDAVELPLTGPWRVP